MQRGLRSSVVVLLAIGSACLHGSYEGRLEQAKAYARWELVERSTCTFAQAWTCENDPRLRVIVVSDSASFLDSWFSGDILIAERVGGCVGSVTRGFPPARCDRPDSGVLDLCPLVLDDVVVASVEVLTWPDGGVMRQHVKAGQGALEIDRFWLDFDVPPEVREPAVVRLKQVDDGVVVRASSKGPPLRPGDVVETDEVIVEEPGAAPRRVAMGFNLRLALRDGGR